MQLTSTLTNVDIAKLEARRSYADAKRSRISKIADVDAEEPSGTLIIRYRSGNTDRFPGVSFSKADQLLSDVHDGASFTGSLHVKAIGYVGFVINLTEVESLTFRLDDAEDPS
ncbi:hypothetical protein [Paracoccus onubensis]|nr:hypothetical protein [Paracoccus onubensis]